MPILYYHKVKDLHVKDLHEADFLLFQTIKPNQQTALKLFNHLFISAPICRNSLAQRVLVSYPPVFVFLEAEDNYVETPILLIKLLILRNLCIKCIVLLDFLKLLILQFSFLCHLVFIPLI